MSFHLGCYHPGGCTRLLTEANAKPGDASVADILKSNGWTIDDHGELRCHEHKKGSKMAKAKKTAAKKTKRTTKKKLEAGPVMTAGANPRLVDPQSDEGRKTKLHKPHTKDVMVDANTEETASIALELCSVLEEEAKVKEKKRESNAGYREKLAGLDDRKKKLSECVRSNRKLEPVRVQEWLVGNEVQVCRIDTGEIVEKRTATSEDLQAEIPAEGLHEKHAHKALTEPAPPPEDDDGED